MVSIAPVDFPPIFPAKPISIRTGTPADADARALGIGFYDSKASRLAAEGYDGPDPAPLVVAALALPPATTGRIDGFMPGPRGAPAYVFRLRNDAGDVIAVATLLTRDGEYRPYSFVQSMVQPASSACSASSSRGRASTS